MFDPRVWVQVSAEETTVIKLHYAEISRYPHQKIQEERGWVMRDFPPTWPKKNSKITFWWEDKALLYLSHGGGVVYTNFFLFFFLLLHVRNSSKAKSKEIKALHNISLPCKTPSPPNFRQLMEWGSDLQSQEPKPIYLGGKLQDSFLEQWFSKSGPGQQLGILRLLGILWETLGEPQNLF